VSIQATLNPSTSASLIKLSKTSAILSGVPTYGCPNPQNANACPSIPGVNGFPSCSAKFFALLIRLWIALLLSFSPSTSNGSSTGNLLKSIFMKLEMVARPPSQSAFFS
jgi:hypothetical protein